MVRPWIGIGYLPVDDAVREYFGLPASTKGLPLSMLSRQRSLEGRSARR